MRRLARVAGTGAIVLSLTATAVADKARADKLFEDGRRYLAAKEYALACTAFEQSHEADPAIGTQLNIALCYEDWGKIASAYRAYLQAERVASEKGDKRVDGARKKLAALEPRVPHLTLALPADADPSAVLRVDGKEIDRGALAEPLLLDPGPHQIEARVPGKPPTRTEVELALGDRRTVAVDVPKPDAKVIVVRAPRSTGKLYGGLALTLGGVGAIGAASFIALAARQDYTDALAGCPELVCRTRADYDATQDARSRANMMTFVGAAGVVLAGAGVYLMLTSGGKRTSTTETAAVTITPTVTPDGIGVTLGGTL